MVEKSRRKTSTAGPPRRREEADIIMISPECLTLEGIDAVMKLLSEGVRRPCKLTWFWVGRIADGVRASSSALYGFCVGLVLPRQFFVGSGKDRELGKRAKNGGGNRTKYTHEWTPGGKTVANAAILSSSSIAKTSLLTIASYTLPLQRTRLKSSTSGTVPPP